MQRKSAAEVGQEGAKNANNIRSGNPMGSPWAARGAGRWNDGGWRRREEEVNSSGVHAGDCPLSNTRAGAADLGATPSFHRLLNRAVTIGDPWEPLGTLWDPLGIPWGSLGDPLGRPWGPLGTSWGPLGDLLRTLEDPLVTLWGPLRTPWRLPGELRGRLGVSLRPLGDPLGIT